MAEVFLTWRAPEFEYREKGPGWYWLSIFAAVGLMALALWQKNFLFAVFIVVAEVLIVTWGSREPNLVEFKLTAEGLGVGDDKLYLYREIENFSLDENSSSRWVEMNLRFKRALKPKMKIQLPRGELGKIIENFRNLAPGVKEVEFEESLTDTAERIIKF